MARTVLTYGTFDLFHIGHLNLLSRAKSFGDRLVVAVSTDEFNAGKGKRSLIPFEHRKAIVEAVRHVDLVIAEESWEQKLDDIKKYQVDVFVMGDDWEGKFDFLKSHCEVVYLARTKNVSSTQISGSLDDEAKVALDAISQSFSSRLIESESGPPMTATERHIAQHRAAPKVRLFPESTCDLGHDEVELGVIAYRRGNVTLRPTCFL